MQNAQELFRSNFIQITIKLSNRINRIIHHNARTAAIAANFFDFLLMPTKLDLKLLSRLAVALTEISAMD